MRPCLETLLYEIVKRAYYGADSKEGNLLLKSDFSLSPVSQQEIHNHDCVMCLFYKSTKIYYHTIDYMIEKKHSHSIIQREKRGISLERIQAISVAK